MECSTYPHHHRNSPYRPSDAGLESRQARDVWVEWPSVSFTKWNIITVSSHWSHRHWQGRCVLPLLGWGRWILPPRSKGFVEFCYRNRGGERDGEGEEKRWRIRVAANRRRGSFCALASVLSSCCPEHFHSSKQGGVWKSSQQIHSSQNW